MAVATAPGRTITSEEQATAHGLFVRAGTAMQAVETYDQAAVDRLCRAVAWAGGNEATAAWSYVSTACMAVLARASRPCAVACSSEVIVRAGAAVAAPMIHCPFLTGGTPSY